MNGFIPVRQIAGNGFDTIAPGDLRQLAEQDYTQLSAYLISRIPAEKLLTPEELRFYHDALLRDFPADPISAGKLVVVLKATHHCNLRCTYCHSWPEGPNQTLTFRTLAHAVRQILSIPNISCVEFVWHGGEVTLLKPNFFKKLIWLQQKFKRPGQHITNSMQSNAVNISDEWLAFIRGIGMAVGISLDGVPRVHDRRRVDYQGRGTAERVERGIQRLRRHDIPYGGLIAVDRAVYETDMREMFDYFRRIELGHIEFLDIVPDNRLPAGRDIVNGYISYTEFIAFLSNAFTLWWHEYREALQIPLFTDFIRVLDDPSAAPSACYWSGNCSVEVITLEPDGFVSPCDNAIGFHGGRYGSPLEKDLASLLKRSAHNRAALDDERQVLQKRRDCRWFSICHGGCSHDRIIYRRHVAAYDDSCCGAGKLLATIKSCLDAERIPEPAVIPPSLELSSRPD